MKGASRLAPAIDWDYDSNSDEISSELEYAAREAAIRAEADSSKKAVYPENGLHRLYELCYWAQLMSDAAKGGHTDKTLAIARKWSQKYYRSRFACDRYLLKRAFLKKACLQARQIGLLCVFDPQERCLYIETPAGQLSFHSPDEFFDELKYGVRQSVWVWTGCIGSTRNAIGDVVPMAWNHLTVPRRERAAT